MSAFDHIVQAPTETKRGDVGVLRYLEALTYQFEREGQAVSCILTYAEPDPDVAGTYRTVVAADMGHEGIACLDDTARAALLALDVHERTGSRRALALARQWLAFAAYMQYPDGSFANFIRNAAGIRNASGPTSHKGGYWWSVRALWALARAYRVTGERRYLDLYQACRLQPIVDGKIRAVMALAEMELYRRRSSQALRRSILEHCDVILSLGDGDYLRDSADSKVHLWGYHQLYAVASAGTVLERPDLYRACRPTVRNLVEPAVRAGTWYSYPDRRRDGVCAYCVTPLVQGLGELYRGTGQATYRRLALNAAAWFYGRNEARTAMYDPTTGMCRDGISHGIASGNCGAESAIEAGIAEMERRSLLTTE